MAMWGLTVVFIIFGYRPPPRHARLDGLSIWQKIQRLDLPGMGMVSLPLSVYEFELNLVTIVDCRLNTSSNRPESWASPLALEQWPGRRYPRCGLCDLGSFWRV